MSALSGEADISGDDLTIAIYSTRPQSSARGEVLDLELSTKRFFCASKKFRNIQITSR
jgi:hypothetical protein